MSEISTPKTLPAPSVTSTCQNTTDHGHSEAVCDEVRRQRQNTTDHGLSEAVCDEVRRQRQNTTDHGYSEAVCDEVRRQRQDENFHPKLLISRILFSQVAHCCHVL